MIPKRDFIYKTTNSIKVLVNGVKGKRKLRNLMQQKEIVSLAT